MNETNNPNLKKYAQKLRREMTKEERHLWYDFLKTYPVQFRRQYAIGCYFADCYEEGSIRWSNADLRFSFVPIDEQCHWGIDDTDTFEIIGNIHDNPEWLKGGDG